MRSKHLGLEYRKFLHEIHLVLRHHSFNDLCFLLSANSLNPPILVGSLHFLYGPQRGKVFLLGTQGAMFYNMVNYHTLSSSSSSSSEFKDSYFSNNLSRYSSAISCIFVKYPTTSIMNSGGNP